MRVLTNGGDANLSGFDDSMSSSVEIDSGLHSIFDGRCLSLEKKISICWIGHVGLGRGLRLR